MSNYHFRADPLDPGRIGGRKNRGQGLSIASRERENRPFRLQNGDFSFLPLPFLSISFQFFPRIERFQWVADGGTLQSLFLSLLLRDRLSRLVKLAPERPAAQAGRFRSNALMSSIICSRYVLVKLLHERLSLFAADKECLWLTAQIAGFVEGRVCLGVE